jgi:hypothetical protein
MEDNMRKSIIPMAVAMVSMLAAPAYAAKYTCVFAKDNHPVGPQCSIDPTTASNRCQQSLGGNLVAACATAKSDDDKLEAVACGFGATANLADAMTIAVGPDQAADFRTLAEKAGFATQNYSAFATASRPLLNALAYRESQTSPVFTALCR